MKRVVSISIGSSSRNHKAVIEFMGEEIQLERIGTDGNMKKAITILESLDGKVDAFGLGGISFFLYAGGRRYVLRDALRLVKNIKKTPIADGSGIKNTLEGRLIQVFKENTGLATTGVSAVMTSAVERYEMARSLVEAGCKVVFADFIFALGIPIPLHSLHSLDRVGRALLPIVTKMPFQLLYPTGGDQDKQVKSKASRFLADARILAGDFHYIRRHMPEDLKDKIIITNTVTDDDRQMLTERGAPWVVTASPNFAGRSFATNVLEALIVAVSKSRPDQLTLDDYNRYIEELNIKPRVDNLQNQTIQK